MGGILILLGLALIATGSWGLYWASKRRFERTNDYGVEQFSSHGAAMGSNFVEGLAKGLGSLSLVAGILLFVVGFVAK